MENEIPKPRIKFDPGKSGPEGLMVCDTEKTENHTFNTNKISARFLRNKITAHFSLECDTVEPGFTNLRIRGFPPLNLPALTTGITKSGFMIYLDLETSSTAIETGF